MDLPLPMRFRHLKKASREAVGVYRYIHFLFKPEMDELKTNMHLCCIPSYSSCVLFTDQPYTAEVCSAGRTLTLERWSLSILAMSFALSSLTSGRSTTMAR